ncbi:MAG: T9SS type A sorting domain-containing protein [Bacteroidia bacterium]|nr:T9SS type A sorting domain-containing protein [Bacteroidia bacterium]
MKKLLLVLVAALLAGAVRSQVVNVSGDITTNTTWTNNNIYLLTGGFVYVTNNATLTIQPGTVIKGQAAALVITRGSKIIANGTATQPIVFTSYQPAGSRSAGDWGGLLILGNAQINDPAGQRLAEGGIDPVKGLYGGGMSPDNNDSSGVLRYVRIEYGGIAFQPNNETNGLTCGGVGKRTVLEYIQVSHGGDDAFEFFGGNVNAKYLVAKSTVDDMFDTDYGYTGRIQFFIGISDSLIADISLSNGFESDNDATGTGNTPQTKPIFSNGTIIGPKVNSSTQINTNFGRALHLRRNTSTCTYNSVFVGFNTGLKIESAGCTTSVGNGNLQFANNVLAGCYTRDLDSSSLSFGMRAWYNSNSNTTMTNSQDVMLTSPYVYTGPNFKPQTSSPLLTGASFLATNLQDPFFTPVTYRGAIGTTDWTKCWTNFNPQAEPYNGAINNTMAVPTITAGGPVTFCQGGSVSLFSSSASSYLWSNGATTNLVSVNTSGNYTVITSNSYGCSATSSPTIVTVNPLPTATVTPTGSTTFCQGGSVTLNASAGSSWLWSTGATTQSIVASNAGNYNVSVTDANGCSATSSNISVTVNANPTAIVTAGGPTVFCTGDSVLLTSNAASAYLWSTGATTQSIYAYTTGSYSVTITDANGCTGVSNAVNVSVSSSPAPTVTPSGSVSICQGSSVTLTASQASTYLWSTGATTQSITVTSAGTYTVTVTNSNPCNGSGASAPTTVTVNPLPVLGFTYSTAGNNVTFTNTTTGASTYFWSFGDNTNSNLVSPSHLYNNGNWTACLVATSSAGCADTLCQNIYINVGMEESVSVLEGMNVYPNPASYAATLELNLLSETLVTVRMMDMSGRVVWNSAEMNLAAGAHEVKIETNQLNPGLYIISVQAGEEQRVIRLSVQ